MEAVICFSHLRWKFVFQRPQHIMVRLAQHCPVFYIEEPVDAAVGADASFLKTEQPAAGVHVLTPSLPAGSVDERLATLRVLLDELIETHELRAPTLWYYTPMMRAFSCHIEAACVVYDCMDELANFRFAPPELAMWEAELFSAADVVFTGGASLFDHKRGKHEAVRLYPSSVEISHFGHARPLRGKSAQGAIHSAGFERPMFGFHGVIDERMDLALLAGIAEARPQWTFEMIGPVVKIDPASLPLRANIFYSGACDYADLPTAIARWDVAIMPFAINDATRFISPTKTPEYLAAGLPVVSTPITDVIRRYGTLKALHVGATVDEFVTGCDRALALAQHPESWMPEADLALSLDSWDSTVASMLDDISEIMRIDTGRLIPTPHHGAPTASTPPYDYLIVGAGFAGAVLAERLATQNNRRVLVIDRRPHVGGNAYDELDDAGILVHKYGPHIFHTNSDRILQYLSQFTEWRPYEHRVLASVGEQLVPIPINRTTLNALYQINLATEDQAQAFLKSKALEIPDVRTAEHLMLATVGTELYDTFFRYYTEKQWGMSAATLDKAVTARVPARFNTDDRYFTDKHQYMPLHGYTRLFENLLSHDHITVMTNVDFAALRPERLARHTIFSGPIDEYFDHRFGALQYRSLQFKRVTLEQPRFQPVGVVNYPSAGVPYTRITEYTHLTGQTSTRTSLSYEYPCDTGEPYYPVPRPENQALYEQYVTLAAQHADVTFIGRLGTYRYYNMDQVVGQALATHHRLEPHQDASTGMTLKPARKRAYA